VINTLQVAPPVTDSYREFAYGFFRLISRPFYRPVGLAPDQGTQATTARINETVDGSVFDSWRADATYRPPTSPRGRRRRRSIRPNSPARSGRPIPRWGRLEVPVSREFHAVDERSIDRIQKRIGCPAMPISRQSP
jgi:hypothetical protein